jgi:hypothetical protein
LLVKFLKFLKFPFKLWIARCIELKIVLNAK